MATCVSLDVQTALELLPENLGPRGDTLFVGPARPSHTRGKATVPTARFANSREGHGFGPRGVASQLDFSATLLQQCCKTVGIDLYFGPRHA